MKLSDLVARLDGAELTTGGELEISGVTHDSRQVQPGWLFAALDGQHNHGLEFVTAATRAGAVAVLSDKPCATLPSVISPRPRRDMAKAAWALAGDPQNSLQLIAVTGTNGKSTVASLTASMLNCAGITCGCFGTVAHQLPGKRVAAVRTTPEATDLARLLRQLLEADGKAVVMEVSSVALVQDRVAGLDFAAATFTNLSRDHLDFHHDLDTYFAAKRLLFDHHLSNGRRVLNGEDPWISRLLDEPRPGDVVWGVHSGDVHAQAVDASLDGTAFTLCIGDERIPLVLPLVGQHNLANAIAAAASAVAVGVASDAIGQALATAVPLPGRLERVPVDLAFPVFIDYAHTPEALRTVLLSLRQVSQRRLVVVFGAGGDRDQGKRGPMGQAVGELAASSIVTSDNPRSEDPRLIAESVARGVRAAGAAPTILLDRREAIAHALEEADDDCLVVIAGKGHEQTQTIGEHTHAFSDRDVVLSLSRHRDVG